MIIINSNQKYPKYINKIVVKHLEIMKVFHSDIKSVHKLTVEEFKILLQENLIEFNENDLGENNEEIILEKFHSTFGNLKINS